VSRDRAPIFIALCDLLLCVLAVVICAVSASKAKTDGVKPKAEFLITAEWPVGMDSDVDLWVVGPSHKPVFYGSRQVGCAALDRDSLGNSTSLITLADGAVVREVSNKETITIRCLDAGHWDVAVMLYSDREIHKDTASFIPVHIEMIGLNPSVRTIAVADVKLGRVGQSINAFSFELDKDGDAKLVPVPLTPAPELYGDKK